MPYPDSGEDCPVAGCSRGRGPGMLMCKICWYRVPADLQKEVYDSWRQRRNSDDSERYRLAERRHEKAKRLAIEAVERRG